MALICYIHMPGAIVPHVRFLSAYSHDDVAEGLTSVLRDWPQCDRVELYDDWDRCVFKHDHAADRVPTDA